MKTRIFLVLAVFLILGLAGSTAAAATDDTMPFVTDASVPFTAYYETTCWWVEFDAAEVEGEGLVTILRPRRPLELESAYHAYSWFNFDQGPPYPYWSEVTWTFANGDQLFLTLDGVAIPGYFEGTFQITGGTGMLESVTGAGDWWALILNEHDAEIYFDGALTR